MADKNSVISSARLKKLQNYFIEKSFKVGKNKELSEIIDIISDYAWTADDIIQANITNNEDNSGQLNELLKGKVVKNNNIPFCYIIERKSAANAGIANIFNILNSAEQTMKKVEDSIGNVLDLFGADDKAKDLVTTTSTTASSLINRGLEKLKGGTKFDELLKKNNLNLDILSPYKYLYITKETGKKYVMPLVNRSSSFTTLKNNWGKGKMLPNRLQKVVDWFNDKVEFVSGAANLIDNITNFINGSGDDTGFVQELPKSYSYPQDGDFATVNFTLYNTTKLDEWKKNYKFLFLFFLRNLPMRTDATSFVPPLLYDIIIPGVKRLPICAVESINVTPHGMTRSLTCPNFIEDNIENNLIVNVPEAWEVTINFRCLIGNSMNLILAGTYGGLNIETVTAD